MRGLVKCLPINQGARHNEVLFNGECTPGGTSHVLHNSPVEKMRRGDARDGEI